MYDYYLKKPNYLMNILSEPDCVNFSSRQFRGLTYVKEVVENLEKLIQLPGGAYNLGSETTKSMFEISTEFIGLIGKRITVNDVAPAHNLWMNCDKARKYGVTFSSVEDGLKRCALDYNLIK
jgi:dTDP-4-dehydrorhamnose reductase